MLDRLGRSLLFSKLEPDQNGRLTPFEPFERLGGRAGSRRGTSQRVSRLHSFTSCWNPGLWNEKSLEITSGLICPAILRTAAIRGNESTRDEKYISVITVRRDSGALR